MLRDCDPGSGLSHPPSAPCPPATSPPPALPPTTAIVVDDNHLPEQLPIKPPSPTALTLGAGSPTTTAALGTLSAALAMFQAAFFSVNWNSRGPYASRQTLAAGVLLGLGYLLDLYFWHMLVCTWVRRRVAVHPASRLPASRRLLLSPSALPWTVLTSAIPLDVVLLVLLAGLVDSHRLLAVVAVARLNRTLHLVHVTRLLRAWQARLHTSAAAVHAAKLALVLLMLSHGLACLWYAFAAIRSPSTSHTKGLAPSSSSSSAAAATTTTTTTISPPALALSLSPTLAPTAAPVADTGVGPSYSAALYFAVASITSTGFGDVVAEQPTEKILVIGFMLAGVIAFGYLLGGIASSLANTDARRARFARHLRLVRQLLSRDNAATVPPALVQRTVLYLETLWLRKRGSTGANLLGSMPPSLQGEVALSTHEGQLRAVPLFADSSAAFLRSLATHLVPALHLAGDTLIAAGHLCQALVFVQSGCLEVSLPSAPKPGPHATLGPGSHFGEMALLLGLHSHCTIVAASTTEVYAVTRCTLDEILAHFPDERARLVAHARRSSSVYSPSPARHAGLPPPPPLPMLSSASTCPAAILNPNQPPPRQAQPAAQREEDYRRQWSLLMSSSQQQDQRLRQRELYLSLLRGPWAALVDADADAEVGPRALVLSPWLAAWAARSQALGTWLRTGSDSVLAAAALLSVLIVTFQAGFATHSTLGFLVSYLADLPFLLELLYVPERRSIRDMQAWTAVPWDLLLWAAPAHARELVVSARLFRLVRLVRLRAFFAAKQAASVALEVRVAVLELSTLGLVAMHLVACLWSFVACPFAGSRQPCTSSPSAWIHQGDWAGGRWPRYLVALYWSCTTMTTTGFGDIHARAEAEQAVAVVAMLTGQLLFGYALAFLAGALTNSKTAQVEARAAHDAMVAFLRHHNTPPALTRQLSAHLEQSWHSDEGVSLAALLGKLPSAQSADLRTHLFAPALAASPLLACASPAAARDVAARVRRMLYCAGETIVNAGDLGHTLFVLRHGRVRLRAADSTDTMLVEAPASFDDQAFAGLQAMRWTVQAVESCEVLLLTHADLQHILARHADFAARLQEGWVHNINAHVSSNSGVLADGAALRPLRTAIDAATWGAAWPASAVQTLLLLLAVAQLVSIPLHAAFFPSSLGLRVWHYLVDAAFVADLAARWHRATRSLAGPGAPFPAVHATAEVAACLPVELLALCRPPSTVRLQLLALLRANRLLRTLRLRTTFQAAERRLSGATRWLEGGRYVLVVVAATHMLACLAYLLACFGGTCRGDSWAVLSSFDSSMHAANTTTGAGTDDGLDDARAHHYLAALYWTVATTVTTGYGDVFPRSLHEMVFAMAAMLVGTLLYGFIIAGVAASMANADTQRSRFAERLSAMQRWLEDNRLPLQVAQRVTRFYEYVWARNRGMNAHRLFAELAPALRAALSSAVYREALESVPLFQGKAESFTRLLATAMRPLLLLENEYIVRKGDVGEEMFFVHRGTVEVVAEDGQTVFASMADGDFFGEISLVFSCLRTASIRTATKCDLFVLSKTDLDKVLRSFPDVARDIRAEAEERFQRVKERQSSQRTSQLGAPAAAGNKETVPPANNRAEGEAAPANETAPSTRLAAPALPAPLLPARLLPPLPAIAARHAPSSPDGVESGGFPKAGAVEDAEAEGAVQEKRLGTAGQEANEEKKQSATSELDPARSSRSSAGGGSDVQLDVGDKIQRPLPTDGRRWGVSRLIALLRDQLVDGRLGRLVHGAMLVLVAVAMLTVPFDLAFHARNTQLNAVHAVADLVLALDIARRILSRRRAGAADSSSSSSSSRAISESALVLDVISLFPGDLVALAWDGSTRTRVATLLRIAVLLRMHHLGSFFAAWESKLDVNIVRVRALKFAVSILVSTHWVACVWYLTACPLSHCAASSWQEATPGLAGSSTGQRYLDSVYWAVATMTSTGYGDIVPRSNAERAVSILAMVFGKMLYGFVLGSIASTLANADFRRIQYQEHIMLVEESLRERGVAPGLLANVQQYYERLWDRQHGMDAAKDFLHDMPSMLRAEVMLHMSKTALETVPMLQGAPPGLLAMISVALKMRFFMAGDFAIVHGDVGDEMFVVSSGAVEILDRHGQIEGTLRPGAYFGDTLLLTGQPSPRSYRAALDTDLLALSKRDLEQALQHFPDMERKVRAAQAAACAGRRVSGGLFASASRTSTSSA